MSYWCTVLSSILTAAVEVEVIAERIPQLVRLAPNRSCRLSA